MNADRVQIIGVGNIFMGDDAFGCEVAQRLIRRGAIEGVRVAELGIRAMDVAFALMDGYGLNILIDAMSQHGVPGSVYLLQPDPNDYDLSSGGAVALDGHSLDPLNVLRMVSSLGGQVRNLLIVGCEPADLGGEDGRIGLSTAVAGAIEPAIAMIDRQVAQFFAERASASVAVHD